MKTVLLVAALSIYVWPTGTLAADPPRDRSEKTAAVSQPAEAPGAEVKAFIHPETGEILTYEQWETLGITSDKTSGASGENSSIPESQSTPLELEGRRVDLGNGDYVIIADTPASGKIKTRARFDKDGKAHITCDH